MNKPYEDPAVYQVIRAWCASLGYARPSDGDCMALSAALSPTPTACKGMNCAASADNGFAHSPECLVEHSAAIDGSMTDVKYPEHVHLAWRGALKACGVSAADVDEISKVVRSMLAEDDASATCEVCGGSGEYFAHADDCNDNLCALNGDAHSCAGQVVRCDCSDPDCQYAKDVGMWPEHRCAVKCQYADATCALRGADEARQFPDNTCPASRHAQMIGEAFINGEGLLGLDQDMPHIGQSILATVEALYRARTALRGEQKESGWRQVPAWVHDLVLSGDLEPVLMRAGEEATRLGLYRARQELLSSLPSAPTSEGEAK